MQLKYIILRVDDQDKALAFYTSILGFEKRDDLPGPIRWLTLGSPAGVDGVELVLEPNDFAPVLAAQKALFDSGFPAAVLASRDIRAEYDRLRGRGVSFRSGLKKAGAVTFCFFEDTCGNILVLSQRDAPARSKKPVSPTAS
jgi:catechol 2,3-dioxygenase-like lactoylglutathione lyase family enzyme